MGIEGSPLPCQGQSRDCPVALVVVVRVYENRDYDKLTCILSGAIENQSKLVWPGRQVLNYCHNKYTCSITHNYVCVFSLDAVETRDT